MLDPYYAVCQFGCKFITKKKTEMHIHYVKNHTFEELSLWHINLIYLEQFLKFHGKI